MTYEFSVPHSRGLGLLSKSDPVLKLLEMSRRQAELPRCLMTLEKLGEINPTSLANAGIAMLGAKHERKEPNSLAR